MVEGDIFLVLVKECARELSLPLANIFNTVTNTLVWPIAWKKETVSVIPKKNIPEFFADLRNISCMQLFSKIYESFVMTWALEEIEIKNNQYGGAKGCPTAHMLVKIWQEICENCECYRSGTVVAAIDYVKSFNRVSYQQCLKAFKKKGASNQIIRLVTSFLSNRTMSVKLGSARSDPKDVDGGCPQGSVLGVLLFNVTTDDLEDHPTPHDSDLMLNTNPNAGQLDDSIPTPDAPSASTPQGHASQPFFEASPLGCGRFRVRDCNVPRLIHRTR